MFKEWVSFQKGNVRFAHPPRPILTEVASTLAAGLSCDFPKSGTVYVGILHPGSARIPDDHVAVGIQTEQFYDEMGQKLETYKWQGRRQRMVNPFDHVLDFSYPNRIAYEPMKGAFHFGPWVFPDEPCKYVPGDGPLTFFGRTSERRDTLLSELSARTAVEVLPWGTFGDKLTAQIANARAIINIHYWNGVYVEVPRILSAYRAGKVVVSDPLPAPFVAGKHYIPIEDPNSADPAEVYANLTELAQSYRLSDFLNSVF